MLSNPENLRKISIVSCLPEKVQAYYPELGQLHKAGIDVEFGPINRFMSFLMGKNVASPDFDWMRKELVESRPDPRVSDQQQAKTLPTESTPSSDGAKDVLSGRAS